jgi:hypothetical protein
MLLPFHKARGNTSAIASVEHSKHTFVMYMLGSNVLTPAQEARVMAIRPNDPRRLVFVCVFHGTVER